MNLASAMILIEWFRLYGCFIFPGFSGALSKQGGFDRACVTSCLVLQEN